ncbi:MAG: hypothetical protein HQ500_02500, partial [Flavobacteriales bacterium]|nr:hypothetical protein [Flavobacteriales bacterium]
MSKPISFSEFLKEGALKKEKKPKEEATQIEVKPFRIEAEEALGEADVRAFWKRLRHFFRTGKLGEVRLGAFVPALIAPYLQHGNWDTDYPFYFSGEERDSLESLAKFHLEETFATEEAKILRENVVRWLIYAREILLEQHGFIDFSTLRDRCTERLSALEVRGEQGERFRADLQKWTEAMPSSGYVTDFNQEV